jgi:hypothetical protein
MAVLRVPSVWPFASDLPCSSFRKRVAVIGGRLVADEDVRAAAAVPSVA